MSIPEIKTPILASEKIKEGLKAMGVIKAQKKDIEELKEGLNAFGKIIKEQKKIKNTPVLSKFVKDFCLDKLKDFLKSMRKIYDENRIKKKETALKGFLTSSFFFFIFEFFLMTKIHTNITYLDVFELFTIRRNTLSVSL